MSRQEPIAIIGIGCRYPGGVHGPDAFWKLLRDGVDAVSEVPGDRWNTEAFYDSRPGQKGKSISRWMGSLDSLDRFDAAFFGLSPREAECMDPQQRMLLQTAWEALDDGGEILDARNGSAAGVFVGISTYDYALLQSTPDNQSAIDVYTGTGGAMSIAANRISHCLNLRGPSLAVDTACSSSLVALHLACRSLWQGECPIAFVGGVNAIVSATTFIGFSQSGMLSPDGRCKAFDAGANGFVRAEGCGVVLLKPLSAARADGNPVYAVIRGTAANQDGRTNGISVPSADAQEALVREACASASISPAEVQYVEAHGTGTLVGDPIEAAALGLALGEGRDARQPLVIGSLKTNIGHLEAGAGVAGIIKTALALNHGEIPPSLHFKEPNPQIDFEKLNLRVAREIERFRNGTQLPVAGVNSFGFGGTNAHAILQGIADARKSRKRERNNGRLLALSARCEESLRGLADKYATFLSEDRETPDNICFTNGAHRTRHSHRLCIAATSRAEFIDKLRAHVAGEPSPGLSIGTAAAEAKPVFVFSGQGPQWWAMGRELLQEEPVFRRKLEECDAILAEFADWSLLAEMSRDEATSRMDETAIAQPAIFALQVALAALWQAWGVEPAACVGHSVGEVAAAHVAGVLSLREAARVIFQRGRCMDLATGSGRMLAASLDPEQARQVMAPWNGELSLAALNGPNSVTFSGEADVIDDLAAQLEKRSIFCRRLRVKYAFHSHQMEPVREELLRSLGTVKTETPRRQLFSTVSGAECAADDFAADYWWRNVRMPVRFAPAIDALIERGHSLFLEVGPHPALTGSIQECLVKRSIAGTATASLRRGDDERLTMLSSLGALHVAGCQVNWKALYPKAVAVRLPSYAWREEQYWHEAPESREARLGSSPHPLLNRRIPAADPTWQTRLDLNALPYLKDHLVQEHIVFPAAGYVEMALAAAQVQFENAPTVLEEIDFQKALVLKSGEEATKLQLSHQQQDSTFTISSAADDAWTPNVVGKMRAAPANRSVPAEVAPSDEIGRAEPIDIDSIYNLFRELGLPYGPMFRCIAKAWQRETLALGQIELPAGLEASAAKYRIHPALLDACFQLLLLAAPSSGSSERASLYLPVQIGRLQFFGSPGKKLWCQARLSHHGARSVIGDLTLTDERGRVYLKIEDFRCQAVNRSRGALSEDELLYQIVWKHQRSNTRRDSAAAISAKAVATRVQNEAVRIRSETLAQCDVNKLTADLDPLCRYYILDAFRQMGWQLRQGEHVTVASLSKRIRVARKHRQVFARFLSFLEEDGLLRRSGDGWKVQRTAKLPDLDSVWRNILEKFPVALVEVALTRACGQKLAGVLRGNLDPLKLIFPEGSLAVAEHLYQDSISFRGANRLVGETIAAVVARLPEGRPLRILEVGAGTGGMTSHILPHLPGDQTEYVFTDVSNLFLSKAEQKFFEFPFVRYQLLDIEKPPDKQDFALNSFDVVLASDAIHAAADLRNALTNVRSLLAPGGLFVLLEVDRPARWPDLVFGLTEGWWRFIDTDLRPSYPLLPGREWVNLLREMEFVDPVRIPDRSDRAKARQAIFLGGAPMVPVREAAPVPLDVHRNGHRRTWLVFADRNVVADRLAALFSDRGDQVITVRNGSKFRRIGETEFAIDSGSPAQMRRLLAEVRAGELPAIYGAIHFGSADIARAEENCLSVLHLVQALSADAAHELPRLFLVTRGANAVLRTDIVSVAQGPVSGLAGVIANEHPKFCCRTIDLPADDMAGEAELLLNELVADDDEDQVALRGMSRYVSRIVPASIDLAASRRRSKKKDKAYRVEIDNPGALDHLLFRQRAFHQPGPGEITFKVKAAALNFRDVMKALGIYPGDNDDDALLGDECSGEIVAVGRDVKNFRVGDAVLAIIPGAFSSHVTLPARLVVRKPRNISFGEAATIPIAFLTAWHAFHQLGQMRKGERVLIQAATGGVGLAALQLAQFAGAEIFATAGSAEKRDFLRALGIQHVMDSRSLTFADEVRAITGGKGVDLVLNSLAGEAISAGLSILATGGRFLEIGKRDIYQNSRIGLRPLRNNASLFIIDLAQLIRDDPTIVSTMLKEIMPLFASGKLRPLPHRLFDVAQVTGAFRYMSQAKHIGKIVLAMENDAVATVAARDRKPLRFAAEATYLITGGLGGFGLAVAEWLLKNGAGHVVVTGRNGATTATAKRRIAELRKLGNVKVIKADVSRAGEVARVFSTIARKLPPLRGILHAAMVLDDGVLAQQTARRFRRVMAPKVTGAWNLHLQSQDLPLDFFVLFSSIASISGSPGQGGYVAANTFLESLAHHRRALGLPGLAINWGAISDVGFVARNAKVKDHLDRSGLFGIPPGRALDVLGRLLEGDGAQFAIGQVDWRKLADAFPIVGKSPRYSEVVEARQSDQSADRLSFRDEISSLPAAHRLAAVTARLTEQIAKVLRTSAAKLDGQRALSELGLDSLMGVELLNRIETSLGVSLPPGHLAAGSSIATIAAKILETIAGKASVSVAQPEKTSNSGGASTSLVPLRAGGTLAPLFCLHSAGGLVNVYENLVRQLPATLPVFGLQSRALFEEASERESVLEIARDYAALIQEKQSSGPIRLLGFSFGGFLAMAVARVLEDNGRAITFVGLIDADLRWTARDYLKKESLTQHIAETYRTFTREVRLLKPLETGPLFEFAAKVAGGINDASPATRVENILRAVTAHGYLSPELSPALLKHYLTLYFTHLDLLAGSPPAVVGASLRVWGGRDTQDEAGAWRNFTSGRLTENFVDGAHYDLMYPPLVNVLAGQVTEALNGDEAPADSRVGAAIGARGQFASRRRLTALHAE